MQGRLETTLKRERNIKNILSELPDYVTDYYINISNKLQPKTCEDYIRIIRRFLYFINKKVYLININEIDDTNISKFIGEKKYKTNKNNKLIKTTVSNMRIIYYSLNSFFNYLSKSGKIKKNPMVCIDKPSGKDIVKRPYITWEDEKNILNSVKTGVGSWKSVLEQKEWIERDILIMQLFMYTGIRRTALSEINVEDIDLTNKLIFVIDKRNKKHEYKITNVLEHSLMNWLKKRKILLKDIKSDALFISKRRNRLSSQSIAKIVNKYASTVMEETISPHKLRAAFITLMHKETGDIEIVRQMVGHENISTTQRYIYNDNMAKEKSISIVENCLGIM